MSTPPDHPLVPPSQPAQTPYPLQDVPQATASPSPPPPAYPYAAPGWSQLPAAPGGWVQPVQGPHQDPDAPRRTARTALGWAIGAAVGAALAMALAVFAIVLAGTAMDEVSGGGGTEGEEFYESLRGQVPGVTEGAYLPGSDLEHAIERAFYDYDVSIEDLSCPDTEDVTRSMAIVCTAEVNGYTWSGVVFFEDAEGSFVVLEL